MISYYKHCSVRKVMSAPKPSHFHRLQCEHIHIEKTYCLQLSWGAVGRTACAVWKNFIFSDRLSLATLAIKNPTVSRNLVPLEQKDWRKGYYSNMRWAAAAPDKDKENAVTRRFAEQIAYDVAEVDDRPSQFGKKVLALERTLIMRLTV